MQSGNPVVGSVGPQPSSDAGRPLKLCMIGLDDYPHLVGTPKIDSIGGESVQHIALARALRQLGVEVSLLVFDEGQPEVHDVDGIRTIAICGERDGMPGLRFIHPRGTSLVKAMRFADADIYYQSNNSYITGLAAWFSARHGKRFVFRISSDLYCIPGRQLMRRYHDRKIYEYGLRHADLILAQTQNQRRLLRTNYGLDSELMNIAVEPAGPEGRGRPKDIDALWVGTFRAVKRPELAIELARRLPHLKFVVVGGGPEPYVQQMTQADRELANFTFAGPVPYYAIGEYFDRTRILLNTSSAEGFPNSFLQSWIRSVPVVTFFDPDGVVASRRLGVVAGNLDEMAAELSALAGQPPLLDAIGARAATFANEHYSALMVAQRYLDLFAARFAETSSRSRSGDAYRMEGGAQTHESAQRLS